MFYAGKRKVKNEAIDQVPYIDILNYMGFMVGRRTSCKIYSFAGEQFCADGKSIYLRGYDSIRQNPPLPAGFCSFLRHKLLGAVL